MHDWPETSESLIFRVADPEDATSWSQFLAIYRPVVVRLACRQGLQHANADDLAQQVFMSVAKTIEHWRPSPGQPPFRVWLTRITRNAIVNALTRRRPDAACGATSVQDLLHSLPNRDVETTELLVEEARKEAFRWASNEIRDEFTQATWSMFWLTAVEGNPVADVAALHRRTTGAVYLARYRVMQRLKEKVLEASEVWRDMK